MNMTPDLSLVSLTDLWNEFARRYDDIFIVASRSKPQNPEVKDHFAAYNGNQATCLGLLSMYRTMLEGRMIMEFQLQQQHRGERDGEEEEV